MIGFVGGGNMAEALIRGMTSRGMRNIIVFDPLEGRRTHFEKTYNVKTGRSNKDIVFQSNIIILAVKPQILDGVLDEIADVITDTKTIVSIAAGITLDHLESRLKTKRLIRVMPNSPALVQEGMSVMSLCGCLLEKEVAEVRGIFMTVGKVLTLPETLMNSVTALSGSGPAFIALYIEAMIESGEKMGLNKSDASVLAVQTLMGTARLLDAGTSPENLMKMVTSPGGTTAAGLKAFEERNLKETVYTALESAKKRAEELGRRK